MRGSLVCALLSLAAACDSKATASDPQSAGTRPEQKSKEYESCGASMHCADELRCFDHVCRRMARSTVGDLQAARGAQLKAKGDLEGAIAAYTAALGHYDSEKVPLPPDVDCAYGAALAAAKSNKDHAELGARVLHRCVLAVPSASPLREKALAELAGLVDTGLDPLLLGAAKTADLYLTKGPVKPATDKLTVNVTAAPQPAKTMPAIVEAVGSQKSGLVACWETYNAASKKTDMTVHIDLKSGYVASEYDDVAGSWILRFQPATVPAGTPEAAADACVRSLVEPALKAAKLAERFESKVTITVK
ncbi:MAG: hypothetical protein JNL83_23745 [Myxococcales bacterium]|nr:hypothetical protein [Myxococcales bacterium]